MKLIENLKSPRESNRLKHIIISIILISYISSAEFNCNFAAANDSEFNEHSVTKGTEELICIHFLPYYVKFAFRIEVDSFSVVTGKHIFDLFQDEVFDMDDIDTVIQISGSQEFSQQIPYIRNADKLVFPFISIKVFTEEGKITDIQVEDLKEACPENNIVPEVLPMGLSITNENKLPLCGQDFCEDGDNSNEDGLCDLKIFITWSGTDSKNNLMLSSSNGLKMFAKNNLKGMYNIAKTLNNNMSKQHDNIYEYEKIPEDVKNRLQTKNTEF